jgi:hypothetical protein
MASENDVQGTGRPTVRSRRVVELADEYAVTSDQMLAICDQLGVEASDASSWIDASTVGRIRRVISVAGPDAVVGRHLRVTRTARTERRATPPELGSVQHDGVRTRRAIFIALIIVVVATVTGLLITQWLDGRRDASPAAMVTVAAENRPPTMAHSVSRPGERVAR